LTVFSHESFSFVGEALEAAPHLLVTGAVHGNEICGPIAIRKIIGELQSGALKLKKGRVTFIPVCNPQAYEKNVRFIDSNLNRSLFPNDAPDNYEESLKSSLCGYLEKADVLLDLHSYHVGGKPFIFVGVNTGEELDFAKSLGAENIVYGWQEAYGVSSEEEARKATGTTEYARLYGAYGVTMECGGDVESHSPLVAEEAIRHALTHLEMIEGEDAKPQKDVTIIKMQSRFYKEREGAFTKRWENFERVPAGTVIARYDDGEELSVSEEMVIVLPRHVLSVGEEWFYLGRPE
jgi:predicted deacylase